MTSRKNKAELRVSNSIHDRLQMESTYIFDLQAGPGEQARRYSADMYIFIPTSLGINRDTYDRESFFKDVTSYFRIRTPSVRAWWDASPEDFAIDSLERYLGAHLDTFERKALVARAVQEVKVFGSFLHTRLKNLEKRARKRAAGRNDETPAFLLSRVERWLAVMGTFRRRYLERIRNEALLVDDEVLRALHLTDEYLSYRIEVILLRVREALVDLKEPLERHLQAEARYRREHELVCLEDRPDQGRQLEAYTYRLGLLKKYLSQALYLKLEEAKRDAFYRNGAAAVGAGLAATFAGLAEQQRIQYLSGHDSGHRLALLLIMAVAAYVFKDRIKDLSKEYFNNRLKHKLPDHRYRITYPHVATDGKKDEIELGFIQEFMRYLSDLPDEVAYLRTIEKRADNDPRRNETVLHLSRMFDFNLRPVGDFRYIKNVLRLDFSEFLAKLDNPAKAVRYYQPRQGLRVVQAPKVYHLNVVMRYETLFGGAAAPLRRRIDFERFRVVLNKNGIVRIERVIGGGELAYTEEVHA
ncbi:MAG: hypothetical protein AB7S38_05495 [Vulcanimicrobiota bacterium]